MKNEFYADAIGRPASHLYKSYVDYFNANAKGSPMSLEQFIQWGKNKKMFFSADASMPMSPPGGTGSGSATPPPTTTSTTTYVNLGAKYGQAVAQGGTGGKAVSRMIQMQPGTQGSVVLPPGATVQNGQIYYQQGQPLPTAQQLLAQPLLTNSGGGDGGDDGSDTTPATAAADGQNTLVIMLAVAVVAGIIVSLIVHHKK